MSHAKMSNTWAALLVDQLVKQGVTHFCVAPGSRSTPLTIAVAEHPQTHAWVHFDERGCGFYALGMAKAMGKTVAVIVTTGTAAGNLLPAIMEASQSYIPLLILTADRPPELRDCSANQTIDQVKIFSSFVRWQMDLPCRSSEISENYLRSTVAQAVFRTVDSPRGVVHINCMFREPFFKKESSLFSPEPCRYAPCDRVPKEEVLKYWASQWNQMDRGIVIVGNFGHQTNISRIYADLAEQLGWPLFADILSPAREHSLAYYDYILRQFKDLKPQAILHLGDRIVSKTLQTWIAESAPEHYFCVSDHPFRQDPFHLVTERLACSPQLLCNAILPLIDKKVDRTWMEMWQNYSGSISENIESFFSNREILTEPSIARDLSFVPKDWGIFIANSMPIRDADLFFFPKETRGNIFANRGVSGIDGNIATAIGIAQGIKKGVVALLGDLTTLHDLNSLALLKKSSYPVIFLIINNHGGAMFSFLPELPKQKCFEEFFAHSHDISFQKAADLFDIPFCRPSDAKDYLATLQSCIEKGKSCILEIVTDRQQNFQFHQEIQAQLEPISIV